MLFISLQTTLVPTIGLRALAIARANNRSKAVAVESVREDDEISNYDAGIFNCGIGDVILLLSDSYPSSAFPDTC